MVIFYPTRIKSTGGSSIFANKLKRGLEAKGHQLHFTRPKKYDLLFVNAQCPPRYLLEAKIKRKPIVHRLDGVYYPTTVAGRHFRLYNLPLQIIHHFFSSYTVYQSKYSKKCCALFLGTNHYSPSTIIYNGVDTKCFNPHGDTIKLRSLAEQTVFITVSRFRRPDQIEPLINAFKIYQKKYDPSSRLYIIGDFSQAVALVPAKYDKSSIKFLGIVPNQDLPKYLRSADVFLHTHLNPPCPNNVIEAMACGLPICGVADGAMREITQPGKNSELIPALTAGFYRHRRLDTVAFADNLHKIMSHLKTYSRHSRLLAVNKFNHRQMIHGYIKVITTFL